MNALQIKAGAKHSQSPTDAEVRSDDELSLPCPVIDLKLKFHRGTRWLHCARRATA